MLERALVVLLALVSCASACKSEGSKVLTVFAASSLTEACKDLERAFEQRHAGVDVQLNFAGSQALRLQIEQGADAEIFASANAAHMQALADAGLVAEARPLAENQLVVIVPLDNPAGLESFADLPEAERLVIGGAGVPVGAYTRELLAAARTHGDYGPDFVAGVRARVVSEESNVRLVRAKVELGEADAAVVYASDAASSERVRSLAIPSELQPEIRYPVAVVRGSERRELAEQFLDFVGSAEGRAILEGRGFSVGEGGR